MPNERSNSVGLIIRETEPENLEFPFSSLAGMYVSNDQFYVRSHFHAPHMDESEFRLKIEGCVQRSIDLTLGDLKSLPQITRTVTLECAGNNRIFLVPQVQGAQWGLGAVGTAEWTGVPLSGVLDLAGVKAEALEVVLEGADRGMAKEKPAPPGEIHYARSVPLAKVNDVLLAYSMNGQPLPPSHGFPLRAIVPGWFGMASVKWLTRIMLTSQRFQGYFETTDYAYWKSTDGIPVRVPITQMQIKAQIARPAPHEAVAAGSNYRIFGAAWGGSSPPVKVEVSVDGGNTFATATLLGEPIPHTWRLWECHWHVPAQPGKASLMARATDSQGQHQPAERDRNWGTYVICHTLPIPVNVR